MSDTTERDAVMAKFYARHNGLRTLSAVRAAVIVAMADEIVQQRRRADRAERILAALREPSEAVVEKACLALFGAYWSRDNLGDVVWRADARQRFITQLCAVVAAAEQEVGRE